ncbi:exported protein of unknown function [Nitrospira defluvii]|jgi:hypothetical protein|uniref:FecR protein domain-containing protein n=1 Tax=Nitrospira defluvii TaxID=330214 RepID=D8PEM9_9BACT|nr:exported protein of unknown function [Nitrospira defluvii]
MITRHNGSRVAVGFLIVLHLVGPGLLWAMEQRGVEVRRHNQAVVSGIRGSDLTVSAGETTRSVRFSEPIVFGEQVRTARDSSAEVLINNQAVVTMLSESDVALEERDGHTVVRLTKGSVLVSAAASALQEGQTVIVETPGAQLATRGGLFKATVGTEPRQTERKQESEGRAQLVSYAPVYPVQTEAILNERFEVYEGTGTIGPRTAGATPIVIEPGQSVQMTGGALGTPGGIEGALAEPGPVLLAVTHHAATPQTGLDLVSQRQMQQVSALQQALYGDPDAAVEGKEGQSGTIISTLFGTNPNQAPPPDSNNPTASLFGTGSPYSAALLAAINRPGSGLGDDGDDTDAGPTVESGLSVTVRGGVGLLAFTEGPNKESSEFKASELLMVDGGLGKAPHNGRPPLSTLVARGIQEYEVPNLGNTSIAIVDPSKLTFQPYELKITEAPQVIHETKELRDGRFQILNSVSQVVRAEGPVKLAPRDESPDLLLTRIEATVDGLKVLKFGFLLDPPDSTIPAVIKSVRNANVQLPIQNYNQDNIAVQTKLQTGIIQQGGDTRPVVPDRSGTFPGLGVDTRDSRLPVDAVVSDYILSDFSSLGSGRICTNCDVNAGIPQSGGSYSFIDARITARSNGESHSPIQLAGGVVLTDRSALTVTNAITRVFDKLGIELPPDSPPLNEPSQTSTFFRNKGLSPAFDGSVAAVVGKENPAFLEIHDRVLAVLDGSSVKPDVVNGQEIVVSLLSVLDSQLIGPEIASSTVGKLHRELVDGKAEISPLLEVENSSVRTTSAVVVRATESGIGRFALDRALLDASSPILTVTNSQFTATGHLIDLAGTGPSKESLRANLVPGDALVRLNGKTMDVAGNFLNLARTSATVNGYLFSLANAGTLNIGGTLLNLTGNSILRLNSDAFGIFDATANTLKVTNALCASGECGLLTDHLNAPFQSSNGKAIQVAGSKTNVQLPQGFTPFRAPSGTTSTVVLDEHAALLRIEPGSELRISVPVVKK